MRGALPHTGAAESLGSPGLEKILQHIKVFLSGLFFLSTQSYSWFTRRFLFPVLCLLGAVLTHGADAGAAWCVAGGTAASDSTGHCSNPQLFELASCSQRVLDTTAARAEGSSLTAVPWLSVELPLASFGQAHSEGPEGLSLLVTQSQ